MNNKEAVKRLVEGNLRFMSGKLASTDVGQARAATAIEQHPIAVVLGCSDSRVSPELVFDQTIGDLFVVRTAGHVLSDSVLGSIEYAVLHLHVELVVVLGHERCGAVTAAVEEAEEDNNIASIVEAIQPAVDQTADMRGDRVNNTIHANIRNVVNELKEDAVLEHALVVGAYYDLNSGKVSLS